MVLWVLACGCASSRRVVRSGEPGLGLGDESDVRVRVRNRSRSDVHGINLRESPAQPWGIERLGPEPLRAGQDRVLRLGTCNRRDVRLIDARGEECVLIGVNLCGDEEGFTITADDVLPCPRWR